MNLKDVALNLAFVLVLGALWFSGFSTLVFVAVCGLIAINIFGFFGIHTMLPQIKNGKFIETEVEQSDLKLINKILDSMKKEPVQGFSSRVTNLIMCTVLFMFCTHSVVLLALMVALELLQFALNMHYIRPVQELLHEGQEPILKVKK